MDNRGNVRAYYERVIADHGATPQGVGYRCAGSWSGVHSALRALLGTMRGQRMLDVGCGHGQMTAPWAASNDVVGVDYAEGMCLAARDAGLVTVSADANALPFTDSAFDVATAVEVLQHLPDARWIMAELARVVRPGGVIIVGTANRRSLIRQASHVAMELGLLGRASPDDIGLPVLRSIGDVHALGAGVGFTARSEATTYFPFRWSGVHRQSGFIRELLASNFLVKFDKP